METLVRVEIEALHRFFEEWFSGLQPNSDAAFARVTRALASDFTLVPPSGEALDRVALVDRIRRGHGTRDRSRFHIRTRRVKVRTVTAGVALATYEEWHGAERRISSAVFRREALAPGGVLWLHVHETWLPAPG